jgi:hypothetical protein
MKLEEVNLKTKGEFSASMRDGGQVALLGSRSRRRAAEGEPHERSSHS